MKSRHVTGAALLQQMLPVPLHSTQCRRNNLNSPTCLVGLLLLVLLCAAGLSGFPGRPLGSAAATAGNLGPLAVPAAALALLCCRALLMRADVAPAAAAVVVCPADAAALKLEDLKLEDLTAVAVLGLAVELLLLLLLFELLLDDDLATPALRCAAPPVAACEPFSFGPVDGGSGSSLGVFAGGKELAAAVEPAPGFAAFLLRCSSCRFIVLLTALWSTTFVLLS